MEIGQRVRSQEEEPAFGTVQRATSLPGWYKVEWDNGLTFDEWHEDLTIVDCDGEDWESWLAQHFEHSLCIECGRDAVDHEPWMILGRWFAHCLYEPTDED